MADQPPEIRHAHVKVNDSLTHIVQYGCKEQLIKLNRHQSGSDSLDEQLSSASTKNSATIKSTDRPSGATKQDCLKTANTTSKQLIVFVPGNPGILGVYHDFLIRLYQRVISKPASSDNERPTSTVIIGLGHNNFDHPDSCNYESDDKICIEDSDLNFVERSIAKEHKPHDVELQVLNKLIILKRLIKLNPDQHRVVFVGHSIGCYVILRLLQDKLVAAAHAGSILIHPALDNLALTERGSTISRYFDFKLDLPLRFAAYICDLLLPHSFKLSLAKRFCAPEFVQSSSDIVIESLAQLACHHTVRALVEMAKSEFENVRDLNCETLIEPHVKKLKIVYATGDGWVNNQGKEDLRKCCPGLYIEEHPTLHAFMMDTEVMTDYVARTANLIRDCLN
jgi:hypothetical protein